MSAVHRRLVLARAVRLGLAAAWLAAAAPPRPARAQAALAGEAELKAEWVRRFMLFTEWPTAALPAGAALQLCVQGRDEAMQRALAALEGQSLRGHAISVRAVLGAEELRGCHVLYLADTDARRLFAPAAGAGTLTIGEAEGFAQAGTIGLVRENARLRFDVNRAHATRMGLKLGSELLKNARSVIDGTGASK